MDGQIYGWAEVVCYNSSNILVSRPQEPSPLLIKYLPHCNGQPPSQNSPTMVVTLGRGGFIQSSMVRSGPGHFVWVLGYAEKNMTTQFYAYVTIQCNFK